MRAAPADTRVSVAIKLTEHNDDILATQGRPGLFIVLTVSVLSVASITMCARAYTRVSIFAYSVNGP